MRSSPDYDLPEDLLENLAEPLALASSPERPGISPMLFLYMARRSPHLRIDTLTQEQHDITRKTEDLTRGLVKGWDPKPSAGKQHDQEKGKVGECSPNTLKPVS